MRSLPLSPAVSLSLALALVSTAAPAKVRGTSLDFRYDAADVGHPERAYTGRVYLDDALGDDASEPRPLVVFLHGTNVEHLPFRWMGGGKEPDLRAILSDMIAAREIPPLLLAAPSSVRSVDVPWRMWPGFDLDRFVERTIQHVRGRATVDLDRVVLVGHSGGACNSHGSIFSATAGTTLRLRAVLAIDGCMDADQGALLGALRGGTDVVVTWQPFTWRRPIDAFADAFRAASPKDAVRVLEELRPDRGNVHDAMLPLTLHAWLPRVLERAPR